MKLIGLNGWLTEPNLFHPHTGLDDCLNMLLVCFRKRRPGLHAAHHPLPRHAELVYAAPHVRPDPLEVDAAAIGQLVQPRVQLLVKVRRVGVALKGEGGYKARFRIASVQAEIRAYRQSCRRLPRP